MRKIMRPGKVSERVLDRSVLREIKTTREEIIHGAGVEENCAVFDVKKEDCFVLSTHQTAVCEDECAYLAIQKAVNNLAADGAECIAVELALMLPENTEEKQLKKIMGEAEKSCERLQVQLAGGSTKVSSAVTKPVATVTGIGKRREKNLLKASPGQDIILTKWVGLEGTAVLAKQKEKELLTRFSPKFVEEAQAFKEWLSIVPEAATAGKSGACRMLDASEGGIFGALWEFGRISGVGLEVDLKKIPIKQQTIEICEFLGLNPYELLSGGALLLSAGNGVELKEKLEEKGIPATIIGKVTGEKGRVIMNGEERRFLELPQPDEIYKLNL